MVETLRKFFDRMLQNSAEQLPEQVRRDRLSLRAIQRGEGSSGLVQQYPRLSRVGGD